MPLSVAKRSGTLAVEEVDTLAALQRLRPEWEALWRTARGASPFQSPAWLIPWWRWIGDAGGGKLSTLALRSGDRLAGLAPLYMYTQPDTGCRTVFPIGVATTDYLELLFEPGAEQAGAEAVFGYLERCRDRWDVIELPQLRQDSALLGSPAPAGWQDNRWPEDPCPVLALPRTVEEFERSLSGDRRRKLRYYKRRAERYGKLRIEAATAATVEADFDALLRLHGARWRSKGEFGVLADARVQRAHREALPQLLALGCLRFYSLRLDGRTVGCFYGLGDPVESSHRRLYCYIGGFDPEYADVAPGTLLVEHAIAEAIRDGISAVDFLRGGEEYKYGWGAVDTWTWRRVLRAAKPALRAA